MKILEEAEIRQQLFGADRSEDAPRDLPAKLAALLRRLLRTERSLYLDGVGTFTLEDDGQVSFVPRIRKRVFLAYAIEDRPRVRQICRALRRHGFDPWMDVDRLMPGQNWLEAIERAIESADYFVPCFSATSAAKRSYFQVELRYALAYSNRTPLDEIYLVPVRLDPCPVPKSIQQQTQYVDLFPSWEEGMDRLLATLTQKPLPLDH